VDVVACVQGSAGGESGGARAKTILQNVEVLSAGQHIERDNNGKPITAPVVNLLVDPRQAEAISLAGSEAKIQLILRNPADALAAETAGTNTWDLIGRAPARPAAPRASKPAAIAAPLPASAPAHAAVELISGTKRESVPVPGSLAREGERE
jgi:pilus assembly protein CpaB